MARGQWLVNPGEVNLHFLDPIPTDGYTFADREKLVEQVWTSMSNAFSSVYGIESDRRNVIGAEEPADRGPSTPEANVVTQ